MVDEPDAGVAARMFYVGATEVVQAPRAREPFRIVGAKEGRSSRVPRVRFAAARGDQEVPLELTGRVPLGRRRET